MKVKMKGIKHVEFYKCKEYVCTVLTWKRGGLPVNRDLIYMKTDTSTRLMCRKRDLQKRPVKVTYLFKLLLLLETVV